jgi:hypothetical protein
MRSIVYFYGVDGVLENMGWKATMTEGYVAELIEEKDTGKDVIDIDGRKVAIEWLTIENDVNNTFTKTASIFFNDLAVESKGVVFEASNRALMIL